jgi:DNA-binding response OmpR family regulator
VELVRAIREIRPGMPVIVITGMPDAEEQYEGLDVTFRVKPLRPPEFIALVRASTGQAAA